MAAYTCTVFRRLCHATNTDSYVVEIREAGNKSGENYLQAQKLPDLLNRLVEESGRLNIMEVTTIPARSYWKDMNWTNVPIPDDDFGKFLEAYRKRQGKKKI